MNHIREHRLFLFTLAILLTLAVFALAADAQQFIVRTVYFQPTDAPGPTQEIIDLLVETQDFYRAEMERHGYGDKTFRLETDGAGNPGIHIIKAKHPAIHYISDTYNQLIAELPVAFRRQSVVGQNNIHLIIVAGLDHVDNTKLGVGFPYSQLHSGRNRTRCGERCEPMDYCSRVRACFRAVPYREGRCAYEHPR